MPRFEKCPKCLGKDIENNKVGWFCYDCDWEEELNQDEKDCLEEEKGSGE